jgi:hypothetical protein
VGFFLRAPIRHHISQTHKKAAFAGGFFKS